MSILTLLIVLIILGGLFWANNTYIAPPILRIIINIVLLVVGIALLFSLTGFLDLRDLRVGR